MNTPNTSKETEDEQRIWRTRFSWTLWLVYILFAFVALALVCASAFGWLEVQCNVLQRLIGATIAHTASLFIVILRHFFPKREEIRVERIDRQAPEIKVTEEREIDETS